MYAVYGKNSNIVLYIFVYKFKRIVPIWSIRLRYCKTIIIYTVSHKRTCHFVFDYFNFAFSWSIFILFVPAVATILHRKHETLSVHLRFPFINHQPKSEPDLAGVRPGAQLNCGSLHVDGRL